MNADDPLMVARLGLALLERFGKAPGEPGGAGTGRVVLVTSAEAGEGRSFVARLLRATLARQQAGGAEVLLCDGHLQPGRAQQALPLAGDAAAALFRPVAVERALAALRAQFALTVIDGPTLGRCGALALQADAVLLVVDAGRTARRRVQRAMAEARLAPEQLAGVVLNRREAGLPRWLGAD